MMNLLETSLRVPLLIRPAPNDPRFSGGQVSGKVYPHTVELLDLFPTIVSLANLAPPPKIWGLPGQFSIRNDELHQKRWILH